MSNPLRLCATAVAILLIAVVSANAQMRPRDGLVSTGSLPAPIISKQVVRLDVPHIRQKPWLCVPTSSAMILRYFGKQYDPVDLKRAAENHKPKSRRNSKFTYWVDMRHSLKQIGQNWYIRDYPKTKSGFKRGLKDIKRSLRAGNPVMVDVHLGQGHTFVVMGYNDIEEVVYIRDPDIASSRSRAINYSDFQRNWHNHRFANSRSAFFSRNR